MPIVVVRRRIGVGGVGRVGRVVAGVERLDIFCLDSFTLEVQRLSRMVPGYMVHKIPLLCVP